MLRRLLIGLVLGLIVGGLVAAGLVAGLGVATFASAGGALLAYLVAALTGVLTGLVAGKPIWSSGAKVEAGLKAVFGALVGAGLMFALRKWGGSWMITLPQIGANSPTAIAELPATSLPLLAAALGAFFGVDNTAGNGGSEGDGKGGPNRARRRVATGNDRPAKSPPEGIAGADSDDEEELLGARAKR
jgi:hypothetical protein